MKRFPTGRISGMTKIAAAMLLAAGVPMAAHAQSNITIYGSMDAGVAYVNNQGGTSNWMAQQGGTQPDRWGFRGVEDLGGGNRAIFLLENGFSTLTGNTLKAGAMFNRQSWVGLQSDTLGTLTIGHMAPFSFEWLGPFSTAYLGMNWYMFHPGNLDELANTSVVQLDNSVKYVTPDFAGFKAAGMISLGNTTNFATGKKWSVAANYTNAGFKASVAYSNENNRTPNVAVLGGATFQNQPVATYSASNIENMGAGVSYGFGPWLLHALYTRVKLASPGYSDTYQSFDGGVNYASSIANTITFGAATTNMSGKRWTQVSLGDVYALSKRTQVYVSGVYQHASGNGAVTAINTIGASSTANQVVIMSGVHHAF
ncbi:Outer membrane porin protein [Pandoraea pneumonica]|jgi:predicted porin|uniref:Outer membrane porin protein n=2 Tax=Pandoraea pneumonica TaxID=2508299 RepID=A0A5E4YQH4_9BURK|nr:Outer membrane porin protein [Pandoraea pneumonica]